MGLIRCSLSSNQFDRGGSTQRFSLKISREELQVYTLLFLGLSGEFASSGQTFPVAAGNVAMGIASASCEMAPASCLKFRPLCLFFGGFLCLVVRRLDSMASSSVASA